MRKMMLTRLPNLECSLDNAPFVVLVKAPIIGGSLVKIGRWRYYQEHGRN